MKYYTIESKVLVVRNTEQMVTFYKNVFDMHFTKEVFEDSAIYTSTWAGMEFSLVPEELSQIKAAENKMHYDIYVQSLDEAITAVTGNGGKTNGQLGEDDIVRCMGMYDPDDNFLVFKERK